MLKLGHRGVPVPKPVELHLEKNLLPWAGGALAKMAKERTLSTMKGNGGNASDVGIIL